MEKEKRESKCIQKERAAKKVIKTEDYGEPEQDLCDRKVKKEIEERGKEIKERLGKTSEINTWVTKTKETNTILTFKHPLLYTADSKAILEMKTPSFLSIPFPSRMYSPKVCPGLFTISTNCTTCLASCMATNRLAASFAVRPS